MSRSRRPHPFAAVAGSTSPRAGFTLIELIVASSVTVGILTSVFLCFLSGRRTQRTVEIRTDLLQNGRVALERIAADLVVACPLHPDYALIGIDRIREEADGSPGIEADGVSVLVSNTILRGNSPLTIRRPSGYPPGSTR